MKNISSDDGVIRDMTTKMKMKFDKYWSDYSIVLALRAKLDSRMKLQLVKHL